MLQDTSQITNVSMQKIVQLEHLQIQQALNAKAVLFLALSVVFLQPIVPLVKRTTYLFLHLTYV